MSGVDRGIFEPKGVRVPIKVNHVRLLLIVAQFTPHVEGAACSITIFNNYVTPSSKSVTRQPAKLIGSGRLRRRSDIDVSAVDGSDYGYGQ